jgi:hypothetical protein
MNQSLFKNLAERTWPTAAAQADGGGAAVSGNGQAFSGSPPWWSHAACAWSRLDWVLLGMLRFCCFYLLCPSAELVCGDQAQLWIVLTFASGSFLQKRWADAHPDVTLCSLVESACTKGLFA